MKNQDILNLLDNKKIIIYGAGKIGKRIFYSLKLFGYKTEFFWDRNADIIDNFTAVPTVKPNFYSIPAELRNDYIVVITVFAENVSKCIADNLTRAGYGNIIYDRKIINSIIYQSCKKAFANNKFLFNVATCHACPMPTDNNTCDIFDAYIAQKLAKGVDSFLDKKEKLVIPKIGVIISNKCTLRCKGCNHLRDMYKPGDEVEFTVEGIMKDLNKIVETVDLINKITIVGGETLLHPNLFEILKQIVNLPKIGIIQLITNGTVVPKNPHLFRLMSNKRIIVEISGYGNNVPKVLQENVQKFISKLRKYHINYQYMNTLQWFDFGDFNKRSYSKKQHQNLYTSCCFVSNDIFGGRIYKCSRSVFATHLDKIPDYPSDYVVLHKYPKNELKRRLIRYFNNKYPKVCLHCNGTSITIKAGIQTEHRQ